MHEEAIAKSLVKQVERICRAEGGLYPVEVQVEMGPLSGIEPMLLESAFKRIARGEADWPTRLVIQMTPLVVRCRNCERESELTEFDFHCRICLSRAVQVVKGDQLQIVSVTVECGNQEARCAT